MQLILKMAHINIKSFNFYCNLVQWRLYQTDQKKHNQVSCSSEDTKPSVLEQTSKMMTYNLDEIEIIYIPSIHFKCIFKVWGLPRWYSGKDSTCKCRRHGFNSRLGIFLEKEMTIHSSIFAWKIPWTEESGGL